MIPFDEGVSATDLAALTGIPRGEIPELLTAAGAPLAGNRKGHPLYQLGPAVRAIVASQRAIRSRNSVDPESLSPRARHDWYAAERKRFALQVDRGMYVPRESVRTQSAKAIAAFVQTARSVRDTLERRHSVSPKVAALVDDVLDGALDELAEKFRAIHEDAMRAIAAHEAREIATIGATAAQRDPHAAERDPHDISDLF